MLKVIIADDEERIVKLIRALVDWEALDMEVAGIAHNGLEAISLIEQTRPEILITDIQMPGCSGLSLIEQVKKSIPELEIIIISGYAHFEYAQSAIKYGVGDYLLKPINQAELYSTLRKLKKRIIENRESESDRLQLRQKNENDSHCLQQNLLEQLAERKIKGISLKAMQEEYSLKALPGIFQAFFVKIDGKTEELSESGMAIVMDKMKTLLESSLRPRCYEMGIYRKNCACIGILNYDSRKTEEIRRTLKDCLNQLEAQKKLYGPVTFSMAVGGMITDPEQMSDSVYEASIIIKERLVKGTGRFLDKMPGEGTLHEQNLLEKYLRLITHAVEIMSTEEAEEALEQIRSGLDNARNVHGYEVLELVISCGRFFLSQLEMKQREQEIRKFEEKCGQCGSVRELFEQLSELQKEYLEALHKKHEDDALRPIRQAKHYIQNHFSEQITLEEVSSVVGLSSAYFSVLFKKSEGEGFAKYLINLRIEAAKVQLRESQLTVAEICRKVGYNDLKHFTHTFEKATGVKPATYRKLYG